MESAPGTGRRILVIDRDPLLRAELRELLQRWGFQVMETEPATSADAPDAVGSASHAVHGVLLALHEASGGLSLLQHTRRSYPGIPVLVVSDVAHIQVARQAVNLGAQEYVIKPFAHDLLRTKCVRVFTAPSRMSSETETQAVDSAP